MHGAGSEALSGTPLSTGLARVFTDTAFTVSLDTTRIERTSSDAYLLWFETRWMRPHQTRAPSAFNRETIHTLLRCEPLAYKTIHVSVSLDAGPTIAEQGGTVADALGQPWKAPKAGSADIRSFSAACAILRHKTEAGAFTEKSVAQAQVPEQKFRKAWIDPSPHRVRIIRVAPNVDIELLDWGGTGDPLVFLAGFGNTAHVFDGFAPQFTDRYHVIGITRRGFGASSEPPSGYDSPTLARDITTALDSLGIARASFVAHSFGGSELNYVAVHSPERVNRLVYLEAGLDFAELYANPTWVNGPFPRPPLPPYHLPRVAGQTLYSSRMTGTGYPESEVRAILKLDARDSVVGVRIVDSAAARLMRGTPHAQFTAIHSPVLAVYGTPATAAEKYPWWNSLDSAGKAQATKRFAVERAILGHQRERFKHEVAGARVVEIPGGRHYVFLGDGPEIAHEMRVFLSRDVQ